MALTLPAIAALPSLPDSTLTHVLDLLFEPSHDLHTLLIPALHQQSFASYAGLVAAARSTLLALRTAAASDPAARQTLLAILGAHPRLGATKVESAQSVAEQAQLQAAAGSGEAERLAALNAAYEAAFPGLRYVVFVNGRSRDVIMANMTERIARGDAGLEEVEAIEAMASIANDRAKKLLG